MSSMNVKKLLVLMLVLAPFHQAAPAKTREPKIATGPMDEGTLDPKWFGEGMEFRETDDIDYLWVKQGFALEGKSLQFDAWPEPELIGEKAKDRSAEDNALAKRISRDMANLLKDAFDSSFRDRIKTSLEEGDILVTGRIVDCNTGSVAAKVIIGFGAGKGNTTVDIKLLDKASGELLVAMHHRSVSGTLYSSTDSKFVGWLTDMTESMAKEGPQKLYDGGSPRNK